MNPNVLMIVYFFPPLGSIHVLRALKFAKYLPEFGWNPIILAVKDVSHYSYDPNLLNELTSSVKIIRTGSMDPFRCINFIHKYSNNNHLPQNQNSFIFFRNTFNLFNRWFSLPDSRFGWYPFAVSAGLKAIYEHNIKLIYSSSPPNISQLIGLKLHRKSKLPWVVDFKDQWLDYPHLHPTQLHRKIMSYWERKIINQSTKIITINPAITEDLKYRYASLPNDKVKTLVHGFDHSEFEGISHHRQPKLTFVHTGNFFEPRQIPDYFLRALSLLLHDNPNLINTIQVQFIGTLTTRHRKLIEDLRLDSIVQVINTVTRSQSIQYQMDADILLLFVGEGIGSQMVLPAKTWEYLVSGRPILCMSPEGITSNTIQKYHAGIIVPPKDVIGIKNEIIKFITQYQNNNLPVQNTSQYNQYNRKTLTQQLATIFNECLTK